MSSESEQDEHLLASESDGELQSLGSQSENEGQDEEDSDSEIGDSEEDDSDSEDDDEDAGLVIDEPDSSDEEIEEEGASEDDGEEMEMESEDDDDEMDSENDEEITSEDEDEDQASEHNGDEKVNKNNVNDGDDKNKNDLKTKIFNKIKSSYENVADKSLYVRFPHRLPADTREVEKTLKKFCNRIINIRRMRQKYARCCLVYFESREDREKGLKELRAGQIDGKKLVVSYPKSQEPDFIEKATEKRLNKITEKKIKAKLTKLMKKKEKMKVEKIFTSTVVVKNIPPTANLPQIKQLFPHAVEVKVNFAKGKEETSTATVTMPTPKSATRVTKKKLKLNDNDLKISFEKAKKPTLYNRPKSEPSVAEEENSSAPSQSPKKGKRKLEETNSEFSTSPKKNKNKPGKPNQMPDKGKKSEKKKGTNNVHNKIPAPLKTDDNQSPKKFKGKKPWKKMTTDDTNSKQTPQNQNPKSDLTNFTLQNETPRPKLTNLKDKKQKNQTNPNAIKNGPNKAVDQIVEFGSDVVPKKQKFGKNQKDTQNPKPTFPIMGKNDMQKSKSRFPIMKKNFQGKGVKTVKVFKNK